MSHKVRKILNHYQNTYKIKHVSDEIKNQISEIDVEDYENYYIEELQEIIKTKFNYKGELSNEIGELNNIIVNEFLLPEFIEEGSCIFEESDICNEITYLDDFNSLVNLNESEQIKSILDEKAEHGLKDNGHSLDSILGSVCNGHYYDNWNTIKMYAETWWKISTSHPFKNGNKRTSFIWVKGKILSTAFANSIIKLFDDVHNEIFNKFSKENITEIHNKILKNLTTDNKPTQSYVEKKFNDYFDKWTEKMQIVINRNANLEKHFIELSKNISKEYGDRISSDYILSLFIASIKSENYKYNDNHLKERVIKIIESDLILMLLNEQENLVNLIINESKPYVLAKIESEFESLINIELFIKEFLVEWNAQ